MIHFLIFKVTYLTEFELNQPMPSSRSSSIINVSSAKTNTIDDNSENIYDNKPVIQSSAASPLTPIHNTKKLNGPSEPTKHGREKQLLHQVFIIFLTWHFKKIKLNFFKVKLKHNN